MKAESAMDFRREMIIGREYFVEYSWMKHDISYLIFDAIKMMELRSFMLFRRSIVYWERLCRNGASMFDEILPEKWSNTLKFAIADDTNGSMIFFSL